MADAVKRAKLNEIDRRYRRAKVRRRAPVSIAALRVRDLSRLFAARHGHTLPNDAAGRLAVELLAHHLGALTSADPRKRIMNMIELRAPWLPIGEANALMVEAITKPKRWRADKLAWKLRLIEIDRSALRITTIGAIDAGKAQRTASRRERNRLAKEAKRRAKGMLPRHSYEAAAIARTKPWIAAGISRRTWYRHQRGTDGTGPGTAYKT